MSSFLALLTACKQPDSDFTLHLTPLLLDSQKEGVLAIEPDIFVKLTLPDGTEEVRYAGVAAEGEALQLESLPPVPTGTRVALVAARPGGSTEEWEPASVVAYGESSVEQDLAVGKQEVDLPVWMPRVEDLGKLGAFKAKDRKLGAAMAVAPNGDVYLFGGGNPEETEALDAYNLGDPTLISSDTVLKATRTTEGWGDFTEVGKIEPFIAMLGFIGGPAEVPGDRRSAMTATVVETQGVTAILVVGGRYCNFPAYFTNGWFLWDPETDTILDKGRFENDRSDHLAFPLGPSKVLIYGGQIQQNDGLPRYEVWDAEARTSDEGNELVLSGGVNAFGAVLGADVIICGGIKVDPIASNNTWVAQNTCHRFRPNGQVEDLAPLPEPLGAAAMAALPDGGLLVTGGTGEGFVETVDNNSVLIGSADPAPAVKTSYRWSPSTNQWTTVGELVYARANHKMVPLSNGQVMVIGGTEMASTFLVTIGAQVRCIELFDPATDTFTASTCSDAGQGALPEVAVGATEIGVLEGFGYADGLDGGGNYGVIGRLPE